jgi:hypothetical protein
MYWLLIDLICVIAVSAFAVLMVQWLHVDDGLHILFATLGSLSFFFGKYLTGSGDFARFHLVNTATPEVIWKMAGIICWAVAAVSFFYNLP